MDQTVLKVKEDTKAANRWHLWCRLCAKETQDMNVLAKKQYPTNGNGKAVYSHLLAAKIKSYFCVKIACDKELPSLICAECYTFINSLETFKQRVAKVQQMFNKLNSPKQGETIDLPSIRQHFGLKDEQHSHVVMPMTLPETYYCEAKRKYNQMDNKLETTAITIEHIDPLEQSAQPTSPMEQANLKYPPEAVSDNNNKDDELKSTNRNDNTKLTDTTKLKIKKRKLNENVLKASQCTTTQKHGCSLQRPRKRAELVQVMKASIGGDSKAESDVMNCKQQSVACPYCEKIFATHGVVQTHIKAIHMDERPFVCEECGVAVRTSGTLKEHMLTHTDAAPFVCSICQKGFKNRGRLRRHLESHDPTKHVCTECGLQLNTRTTLNRHSLVHSDVMQHKCDYCGRAFKRGKTLKNHLIVHTGLRPYSCDFCEQTFAVGPSCRLHMRKSHAAELAAQEATGCATRRYTQNIPKLEALKAITKGGNNLSPVYAFAKKPKTTQKSQKMQSKKCESIAATELNVN